MQGGEYEKSRDAFNAAVPLRHCFGIRDGSHSMGYVWGPQNPRPYIMGLFWTCPYHYGVRRPIIPLFLLPIANYRQHAKKGR